MEFGNDIFSKWLIISTAASAEELWAEVASGGFDCYDAIFRALQFESDKFANYCQKEGFGQPLELGFI